MITKWELRDMDNRDDTGAPWEVTDTPRLLSRYLDEAVRNDLVDDANTEDLDALIAAFKSENLTVAQILGKSFGIYVREVK